MLKIFHYLPSQEGGYAFFSGTDGSSAFITGEFNEEGLTDDISSLEAKDVLGLNDWLQSTYFKLYPHQGRFLSKIIVRFDFDFLFINVYFATL